MSKIDYQALREKAEKATCGEWSLEYGESRFDGDDALIHREVAGYIPICRIEGAHPESGFDEDFQMEQQANAEFIAAANPATVLALLDERERNQQYIKRRDQENEDIALTVGKLRVELEGKDKLIAELGKQCAEWERKASSNFEECAAMAERIEELEKATTGQDANINSQQERVAQSANRHVYHYNAVSNVSGITMSGIAQSPFRIKSQSDLEEFKSALSKVCGFHATAVTSLSYLGREEEEQNDEKP
ncbi:ead/Ea22-like family protein [Escherichia coli]|nr:ead/Ea22-like family protein [Escherichia coli]EFH2733900.1 ead/Ea22-like family protein [Escherichia coli]EFH5095271.1 ead/Ea22-like family protein [Escherichia coli]EHL5705067.1 ead/Ea22-like family protein [Escherichia coli]EHZ8184897.1 ead/Ea22-like family protein [Escherichia coli]